MVWLILAMTIAVILAAAVVAVVAIPARRAGRFVLTARGEKAFRVADERARAARTLATRRAEEKKAQQAGHVPADKNKAASASAEKNNAEKRDKAAPAPAEKSKGAEKTAEPTSRAADTPRRTRRSLRAKK